VKVRVRKSNQKISEPITTENLVSKVRAAGFHTVKAVAKSIGKSRVQIYRALHNPRHHKPTYKLLNELLNAAPQQKN
jgi:hypothetical protein